MMSKFCAIALAGKKIFWKKWGIRQKTVKGMRSRESEGLTSNLNFNLIFYNYF